MRRRGNPIGWLTGKSLSLKRRAESILKSGFLWERADKKVYPGINFGVEMKL